ncbi:hypothetical protein AVEN_123788-1 [Araneus ventricosus]|uniref:Uncharacterized protein n=1 Tax=Araneus ventricosus TaxID=182803 RepID=A0A4Y2BN47_ARAVE|nr:hypothetical protein AVEN_123788-1 [Araneus ventricosus]
MEQRVEAEDDDWIEDEEDNEKKKRKIKSSRRKFFFKYFFFVKGEKIHVCKCFYLGTLSISQNPVYTVHSTKNIETNTPTQDQRGKNGNSRRVPKGDPVLVREHMKSFPVVESHYRRAHTKRKYLVSHLSIVPPSVLH